jgi:hypothetical protein
MKSINPLPHDIIHCGQNLLEILIVLSVDVNGPELGVILTRSCLIQLAYLFAPHTFALTGGSPYIIDQGWQTFFYTGCPVSLNYWAVMLLTENNLAETSMHLKLGFQQLHLLVFGMCLYLFSSLLNSVHLADINNKASKLAFIFIGLRRKSEYLC